jgi:hypothetical protein
MVAYESRCTPPCDHEIFINFRTGDEGFAPDIVYQMLANEFGAEKVFFSSNSIPIGARFPDELSVHANRCAVMLSLIGDIWLTIAGDDGRPKIADPKDWVRREIVTALTAGREVIPVLLDKAPRLSAKDLPKNIAELASKEACKLRPRGDTDGDFLKLKQCLVELIPSLGRPSAPSEPTAATDDIEVKVGKVGQKGRVEGRLSESLDGRTPGRSRRIRVRARKVEGVVIGDHEAAVLPPQRTHQ